MHAVNKKFRLLSLPAELLVAIFSQLPLLSDIFALAATSARLRNTWVENAKPIYDHVGPRSIPCERCARALLNDQRGSSKHSSMTPNGILNIVRNAHRVEDALLWFANETYSKVCRMFPARFKQPRSPVEQARRKQSHNLTRPECRRFRRAYYILLSLINVNEGECQARLDAMSTKQLYQIFETSIHIVTTRSNWKNSPLWHSPDDDPYQIQIPKLKSMSLILEASAGMMQLSKF